MRMFIISSVGLFLVAVASVQAASQLDPLFKALARDPRSADAITVDLFKAVPSEEVPVIVSAIKLTYRVFPAHTAPETGSSEFEGF
jgi:hypothetical protein